MYCSQFTAQNRIGLIHWWIDWLMNWPLAILWCVCLLYNFMGCISMFCWWPYTGRYTSMCELGCLHGVCSSWAQQSVQPWFVSYTTALSRPCSRPPCTQVCVDESLPVCRLPSMCHMCQHALGWACQGCQLQRPRRKESHQQLLCKQYVPIESRDWRRYQWHRLDLDKATQPTLRGEPSPKSFWGSVKFRAHMKNLIFSGLFICLVTHTAIMQQHKWCAQQIYREVPICIKMSENIQSYTTEHQEKYWLMLLWLLRKK